MTNLFLIALPICFFVLAILFGMVLAVYLWEGKKIPRIIAVTHGAFALSGLVSLIFLCFFYNQKLWASAFLFIMTAFGGLYLFSHDIKGKAFPINIAILHGLLAIISFLVLVILLSLT